MPGAELPFMPTHDEWTVANRQLKATAGRLAEVAAVLVRIEQAAKAGDTAEVVKLCREALRGKDSILALPLFEGANEGSGT